LQKLEQHTLIVKTDHTLVMTERASWYFYENPTVDKYFHLTCQGLPIVRE
jgi:hypothetical protein